MATSTIKSAGGDYSSLVSWEAAKQNNITGLGPEVAECYNFSLTETVTINGWTTTASDYIRIYAPTAERHDGTAATGFKLTGGGSDSTLRTAEEYCRFEGLIVVATGNFMGIQDVGIAGTSATHISHCIIYNSSATSTGRGIMLSIGTNLVWNNIVYNFNGGGSVGYGIACGGTAVVYAYNNTVNYCRLCFVELAGTMHIKNNIAGNSDSGCYSGTFHADHVTNISDDTTSPDNSFDSLSPTYVNEAGDDYHLDAGDTAAKGAGTDLSGDGTLPFSDDIDGDTRSDWSIGADDFAAAGGGFVPFPKPRGLYAGEIIMSGGMQ